MRVPSGCHECSRRRIKCDRTEPSCVKCQRKGLQCSGQGLRYRFTHGVSSGGKLTTSKRPGPAALTERVPPSTVRPEFRLWDPSAASRHSQKRKRLSQRGEVGAHRSDRSLGLEDCLISTEPSFDPVEGQKSDEFLDVHGTARTFVRTEQDSHIENVTISCTRIPRDPVYEVLDPQSRFLFQHFSYAVAPVMVVFDGKFNGYRDIILPLALQDNVLRRAVSVVAAQHINADIPALMRPAAAGQLAIISKLRRDSFNLSSTELFNASTWATILMLLVGETITGEDNFAYLLEMLVFVSNACQPGFNMPANVYEFFMQQTRMFQLFGFPLAQESKGVTIVKRNIEHYLDFMTYTAEGDTGRHANSLMMKAAVKVACEIYRHRAENTMSKEKSVTLVNMLRMIAIQIRPDTDGVHALVWSYFIAAAESTENESREFFARQLRLIYSRTKFRSIPSAMKLLELIWSTSPTQRWTEILALQRVLVM